MNKKKKVYMLLAMLCMCMFAFGACSSKEQNTEGEGTQTATDEAEKVVTLALADPRDISLLDAAYGAGDNLYQELIYEPLVVFGEGGTLEPGLAKSWDISEDGKEYTFYLQEGVKFSDGTDFNADAVLFTTDRWAASTTTSLSVFQNLSKVEKIDDYTVKMIFEESYYPYLIELSYPRPTRMMSPTAVEPAGDVAGEFVFPIGTGRWMVESHDDSGSVLVPNPHYRGEAPNIDKIEIKAVSDAQARLLAIQSGEVDFLFSPINVELLPVIEGDEALEVMETPGTSGYFLMFNEESAQLQDVLVRRAINYAVNNEGIVKDLLDGHGVAAGGVLPTTNPYITPENNVGYEYDVEKAKALLEEAGYQDLDGDGVVEKDGEPLMLDFVFQSAEFPDWKPLCEYLEAQLRQVGVGINLEMREVNAYYDAIWTNRDYDLIIYRTYADSWNPHGFLKGIFYKPEEGNAIGWYDERINTALDNALASTDEDKRQAYYDEIMKIMYEEAVSVPLYYPQSLYAYNARLTNLEEAATSYEVVKWEKLDIVE
jgi:ABC-type dipeptide transport system, periplasmic component